jgi:predicted DNA-binding transcriptional regulator AlpA
MLQLEDLMTKEKVAEELTQFFGVSIRTVKERYMKRPDFPLGRRVGKNVIYSVENIHRWLAAQGKGR